VQGNRRRAYIFTVTVADSYTSVFIYLAQILAAKFLIVRRLCARRWMLHVTLL